MLSKIRIFLKYPIGTKLFVLEILFFLSIAKICVRLLPFSILSKNILLRKGGKSINSASKLPLTFLKGTTYYFFLISKNLFWNSVCLDQALAARWVLNRRNISSQLYFGVLKGSHQNNVMKAHAWLMVNEYCITGQGFEKYQIIHRY